MRKSKVLSKLSSSGFVRMAGLGHYLPFYIRYAAHFKYDGLWFDLEHRAMDAREVQSILAMCKQHDIDCMVRPPTLERTRLYRYLEDGATGFMIPFMSTADVARHVVDCTKFPPLGNRGIDGAGVDGDFGIEVWKEGTTYFEDANRETFIVGQIETVEGLSNVDAIAAVEGIDVVFIGPADLTHRLETDPNVNWTLDDAISRVSDAAERHGKAWGITAGSPEQVAHYRGLGAGLVPWGGDFNLMKVLELCSKDLDAIPGA
ncbi:MAG: aldolase/citrate lyase family protein [Gemmatimonadetes bacterium]|nr:aldolase/citrate lyase family protein [Gemmatimonadota bacterium]